MSEQKRVTLTTITSTLSDVTATTSFHTVSTAASLRFGNDFRRAPEKAGSSGGTTGGGITDVGANSNERKGGSNKTVRLKLELFQTDSSSYPEFNYSRLVHLEKKKQKKLKQRTNGFPSDPFEVNDDDVVRIAKELEAKYGATYGSGRGRSKKDDHCDIGLGYDESDSFIDNTEAYDEIIPEEVETVEGGFYINCGALEFKKLYSEPKTRTDEIIKMPKRPKKRVLSSSSSEESSSSDSDEDENDEEDDIAEEDEETSKTETSVKSKSSGPSEKRHKPNSSAAVKNKPPSQQNGSSKKKDKSITAFSGSSSNSPKPTVDEMGSDSDRERVRQQKIVKTTTVKDMLKAKRDNFLKMQVGGESKNLNGELKGVATKSSDDGDTSTDGSDESSVRSESNQSATRDKKGKKTPTVQNAAVMNEENTEKLRSSDTKLPELESDVISSIHEFKELVKVQNMTGKRFIFNEKLTEVFLKIDEALLCVDKTQRNMVFAHLEYTLFLPKYFFLRKAKQLRIKEEKMKSKRALAKLSKAVIEAMPGVISNYEVELIKAAESQSDNLNMEQPPKMPKKKFPWDSNLRNLLYEVYQVRWTSYPVLGTRKETLEDFINNYMRDKVADIWPSGWMRYEELQRELEKRKAAAKKVKAKKKPQAAVAIASSVPVSATVSTSATIYSTSIISSASPNLTSATATTSLTANSYIKQFEEFASSSRSCANSDTDSVASSSGTSGGVKRGRNSDIANVTSAANIIAAPATKRESKSKTQKTNSTSAMEQAVAKQQFAIAPTVALVQDLVSAPKRVGIDYSLSNVMSTFAPAAVTTANLSSSVVSASLGTEVAPQLCESNSQLLTIEKHSATTTMLARQPGCSAGSVSVGTVGSAPHVIDLDNYTSASDILQTSKQMLHTAIMAQSSSGSASKTHRSSSESDGVEIVGIYQADAVTGGGKQKYSKKVGLQGSRSATSITTSASAVSNSGFHVEPQNSHYMAASAAAVKNNNNNSKRSAAANALASGGILPEFDVTRVVNVLKSLEQDTQKQKTFSTAGRNVLSTKPDNSHQ